MTSCALEVVGRWKHLLTYSYIVMFLDLFGTIFTGGLMLLLLCLVMHQVFFISLFSWGELPSQGGSSFRLFGVQHCGKFGKKEITGF